MQLINTISRFSSILLVSLGLLIAPPAIAQNGELADKDRKELESIQDTFFLSGAKEISKAVNLMGTDPIKACEAAKSANIQIKNGNEHFLRFYARMKEENKLTAEIDRVGAKIKELISNGEITEKSLCNPEMTEGKHDPETQEILNNISQKAGKFTSLMTEAIDSENAKEPALACQKYTEAYAALIDLENYMINFKEQTIQYDSTNTNIEKLNNTIKKLSLAKNSLDSMIKQCQSE